MTVWEHFKTYGSFERSADGGLGINPSKYFDLDTYYTDKVDQCVSAGEFYTKEALVDVFRASGLDALSHYSTYGFAERITPVAENLAPVAYTAPTIPLSGDYKIDSLLMPNNSFITYMADWNQYGAERQTNTLHYYFSQIPSPEFTFTDNFDPLTVAQQQAVRLAASSLSALTGINFQETQDANVANFFFFEATGIPESSGWAVTSSATPYHIAITIGNPNTQSYNTVANENLSPAGGNFELILHEWGHALGLKHPFDQVGSNPITLPINEDKALYTVMSYTHQNYPQDVESVWLSTTNLRDYYAPYDIMAINYIYGTDGLNGNEGLVFQNTTQMA